MEFVRRNTGYLVQNSWQEAAMRPSLRVLSASLLAATIGMSIFGGPDEAVAFSSQTNERGVLIPVGASGHDNVGGLMPLPLWPPARLHKEQCQRNHRGRIACPDRAASSIKR
jgi:hypothetical protein